MKTLYLLQDAQGVYHPINGPTMIGRDLTCQIKLYEPEVSRNHALLWMERKILYIRDENTKNGTYLNEWRIPPEKPIALSANSQVRVGKSVFTVISLQPPVVEPAPQRSSQLPLVLILLVGCLCLCLFALAAGYLLLQLWTTRSMPHIFPGNTLLLFAQSAFRL